MCEPRPRIPCAATRCSINAIDNHHKRNANLKALQSTTPNELSCFCFLIIARTASHLLISWCYLKIMMLESKMVLGGTH